MDEKQFQNATMMKGLIIMNGQGDKETDPIAKEKARILSNIILEGLMDEISEEEHQQTTEKKNEGVPIQVQSKSTRVSILSVNEPFFSVLESVKNKKEEVTSPSMQSEERTNTFVTDEPKQQTRAEEKKASTSKCPFRFDTESENKYSQLAMLRKVAPSASDVRESLLTKYLATALKQI